MDFNLKTIADLDTIHDYLKGILWSIFFNRIFGFVIPEDSKSFLNVPYPTVNFPELDNLIEYKIESILNGLKKDISKIEESNEMFYKCIMIIKFYETTINKLSDSKSISSNSNKTKQISSHASSSTNSQLQQSTEKYVSCWEKWTLMINIINNNSSNYNNTHMSSLDKLDSYKNDFEKNIFRIIKYVDKNKDHIPPIQSTELCPFPYRILFALNTHDSNSLDAAFGNFELDDCGLNTKGNNTPAISDSGSGSQESMEYITTTEAGDIIMGNFDNGNGDINGTNYRAISSGEELLRNGYNFLKKFLE